jgi:hypothetical protein
MADPKMYNTSEIAATFGLTESYLKKMRHLNQGPKYFKKGKLIRYNKPDVQIWLNNNLLEITPMTGATNENSSTSIT